MIHAVHVTAFMKAIFPYASIIIGCVGCVALVLFLMIMGDRKTGSMVDETSGSNQVVRIEIFRTLGRTMQVGEAKNGGSAHASVHLRTAMSDSACQQLAAIPPSGSSARDLSQMASDKNQVMDELLNLDNIPADYGTQMVTLFRDREQDILTRDFAVQHIGLYAQALNRRGTYDPTSAEAQTLRAALDEAVTDTKTIIAAAAFRALADMAAFDPRIDVRRLDARLLACVGDDSAAPAARVMAVHLCGERRLAAARSTLLALAEGASAPTPLRLAARHAIMAYGTR